MYFPKLEAHFYNLYFITLCLHQDIRIFQRNRKCFHHKEEYLLNIFYHSNVFHKNIIMYILKEKYVFIYYLILLRYFQSVSPSSQSVLIKQPPYFSLEEISIRSAGILYPLVIFNTFPTIILHDCILLNFSLYLVSDVFLFKLICQNEQYINYVLI